MAKLTQKFGFVSQKTQVEYHLVVVCGVVSASNVYHISGTYAW